MADWQRVLQLKPEWEQAKEGDISIQSLAETVAVLLAKLKPFDDEYINEERDDIVADFNDLAANEDATADDFDDTMNRLYDWADTSLDSSWNGKKVCWVDR